MTRLLLSAAPLVLALSACSPGSEADGGAAAAPSPSPASSGTAGAVSPQNAANPSAPQRPAAPGEVDSGIPPVTAQGFAGYIVGKPIPMAGPDKPVEQPRISESCRMYKDKSLPDVWIMTDGKGVVQRISVLGSSTLRTAAGIGLGASEAQLRAAYPDLRVERSEYVMPPGAVFYTAGEDRPGLRFDTSEQGKVVEISGGAQPFLGYSEGCA